MVRASMKYMVFGAFVSLALLLTPTRSEACWGWGRGCGNWGGGCYSGCYSGCDPCCGWGFSWGCGYGCGCGAFSSCGCYDPCCCAGDLRSCRPLLR